MAKSKNPKKQAAKLRREVLKLKDLGLIKYNKRHKIGAKEKRAVKKYSDVVSGKAAVIKLPKKEAKKYGRSFRQTGNLIIIPRKKGDRVRFDKKNKEVVITGKRYGKKTRTILEPGRGTKARKGPPRGYKRWYAIPFGNSKNYFPNKKELAAFMNEYKHAAVAAGRKWGFKNWRKYIEIVDLEIGDEPGEE